MEKTTTNTQLELIAENSSDIITILDEYGKVIYESKALERIMGLKPDELAGKDIFQYVHGDDKEHVKTAFKALINDHSVSYGVQFRFMHKDRSWRYLESIGRSLVDSNGKIICIVNSRDVSDRVKTERQLVELSLSDALTGLYNRRGFLTLFEQQLRVAKRNCSNLYILFIDLDGLKYFNDTFGHSVGDMVLLDTAQLLKQTFREVDTISRIGGDEFVVLLSSEYGFVDKNVILERLQKKIKLFNSVNNKHYELSMSIGIEEINPKEPINIDQVLHDADKKMYEQKKAKKKNYMFERLLNIEW